MGEAPVPAVSKNRTMTSCRALAIAAAFAGAVVIGGCAASPPANTILPAASATSWLTKSGTQQDLLYVANGSGTVSIFEYGNSTLVGVLTKFSKPRGECADSLGDVYITDYGTSKIDEYARGGTKPINILDDSPNTPDACSVAPSSRNLAVVSDPASRYGKGNLAVFKRGSGQPVFYSTGSEDHFVGCAYDKHGDLLTASEVGGFDYYVRFYYLPKGGSQLLEEDLTAPSQRSSWPSVQGVVWDGKYWGILSYNKIYRFTINVAPQYIDTITFSGSYGTLTAPSVYRKTPKSKATQFVAADSSFSGKSAADYWTYPAGGTLIGRITKDLDSPTGTAISLAPRK